MGRNPYCKRDSYSRRHIRATQAQLGALIQDMGDRQLDAMAKSGQRTFERQLFRERDAWTELEKAFGNVQASEQFAGIQPIVPQCTIKQLLKGERLAIKNFTGELERDALRVVGRSMLAGEGMDETVKRLKRVKDIPQKPARLHLIARMETARASNAAKQELIAQVNEEFPEMELWQMVKGKVDKGAKTRNHWFTWVLNGTVRNVTKNEYFEVHQAELSLAQIEYTKITGRKASYKGILFKRFELGLRGQTLPSHFGDRDVVVAWRPSWGEMAGPVKHPQGSIADMANFDSSGLKGGNGGKSPPIKPPTGTYPPGSFRGQPGAKVRQIMQDNYKKLSHYDAQYRKYLNSDFAKAKSFQDQFHALRRELLEATLKPKEGTYHYRVLGIENSATHGQADLALSLLTRMFDKNIDYFTTNFHFRPHDFNDPQNNRSSYDPNTNTVRTTDHATIKTLLHELGHLMETCFTRFHDTAVQHFFARTQNDKYESLLKLYPDQKYSPQEMVKKDRFMEPYMGKVYYYRGRGQGYSTTEQYSGEIPEMTELISMGTERMYLDPVLLAAKDPFLFEMIWEVMHFV